MKHKRPPIPVLVLLALLVVAGGFFGIRALLSPAEPSLAASGTIEAVEITISPELGGRVAEALVDEGDTVHAGETLFRLDGTLLLAQRAVAAANLDLAQAAVQTAQANYDLALDAALLESAAARTQDWRAPNPAGYDLPGGSFTRSDWIAAARVELEQARLARDAAQTELNRLLGNPAAAGFVTAETRLRGARLAALAAQDVLTRANLSGNTELQEAAQSTYDRAKAELEEAQSAYDGLKDDDTAAAIVTARAALVAAQELYYSTNDRLLALQTGADSPKVAAAQAVLNQASLAAVQAEASLALLEAQIAKLTVTAPADGVILTRAIQPGEVAAAGAKAMTLGRLDDLTITVFIPEDRYGELALGQQAAVSVDSFPGETFTAVVSHISDQAEFTPRNVQTVEGRSSTVFAIRLKVDDPQGRLKPGMPADVTFRP